MKFRFIRFVFFLFISGILSSCSLTNTAVTLSNDASFVSLYLTGNDSVKKAVFSLDGSTIVNVDSLPYHSKIDSVYPIFSFQSTAGRFLHVQQTGTFKFPKGVKDSLFLNGKDTVDMRQNLMVSNFASDKKSYKIYSIKLNVHQVDPDVYNWTKASNSVSSVNATSQKAIILNDNFFYYLNNGTSAYLYTSANGNTWNSATVTGLPVATPLVDMIQFNGKLFLSRDGNNLYSSANGTNWTKTQPNTGFTFKSLAFTLNNQLWAVVQTVSDASYHFAVSNDGITWNMTSGAIPVYFPINDFASVTFSTITGKQKVLILGGYTTSGALTNGRWSSEDGVYWVDFSKENASLSGLVGGSLIQYDKKLLLFGQTVDNITPSPCFKQSVDEGLSWQKTDSIRNVLPASFPTRYNQSVVVYKPKTFDKVNPASLLNEIQSSNKIFIIGGYVGAVSLTDVWTGKSNRSNFLRK